MKVFKVHRDVHDALKEEEFKTIGLVPTMGALHEGHLSLIRQSVSENQLTIVSIFVNPTQFDELQDLENYPKTLASDLNKLKKIPGSVWAYTPSPSDLYPDNIKAQKYDLGPLENYMEGASREGHFQGVATVVDKLLTLFSPTRAYFGEKDFQQLKIIRRMVQLRQLNVTIVDCPICREEDGLAMSSRNARLSPKERKLAPVIYQTMLKAKAMKEKHTPAEIMAWTEDTLKEFPELTLDYFSIVNQENLETIEAFNEQINARAFIAVKLGDVRLIDNLKF